MSGIKVAHLKDRGVVGVTGADAGKLLQGLITNDMARLDHAPAIHAGLLSPQGKILFEFFVVAAEAGFLLETAVDSATALLKRLQLYRLRAKVEFADLSSDHAVLAVWGDQVPAMAASPHVHPFIDPRLAALGLRVIVSRDRIADVMTASNAAPADAEDYHAHRMALGVPESGRDYVLGDTFPHEALFDRLCGVSFTKGCFVGQEVVSRMEHRSSAKKRIVPVRGEAELPASGSDIAAAGVAIGTLGSRVRDRGLALVRLDRVEEFAAKGVPLDCGGVPVHIDVPDWARRGNG